MFTAIRNRRRQLKCTFYPRITISKLKEMNLLYLVLFLISINFAMTSVLPLPTSLLPRAPSNTTTIGANSSDQVLSLWPDRLPWKFPICPYLKLEIIDYSNYALESEHDGIKSDLDSIIHDIETEGDPGRMITPAHRNLYYHGLVLLWVYSIPGIIRDDMIKVVKAIEFIFFVYTDRARAFGARVMERGYVLAELDIRLRMSRMVE